MERQWYVVRSRPHGGAAQVVELGHRSEFDHVSPEAVIIRWENHLHEAYAAGQIAATLWHAALVITEQATTALAALTPWYRDEAQRLFSAWKEQNLC